MARPGRVELPTLCLEGRRSIQLSYGRAAYLQFRTLAFPPRTLFAQRAGTASGSASRCHC